MNENNKRKTSMTRSSSRRTILGRLGMGLAALPAAGLVVAWTRDAAAAGYDAQTMCRPPGDPGDASKGRTLSALELPDVPVVKHSGERARFSHDLMKGIVMVNLMSVARDEVFSATDHLLKLQRALGDQVGESIFMYSLTIDPARDNVERLARFARAKGVGPGWSFLTGEPRHLDLISYRLFGPHAAHGHALGFVRYGNIEAGLWGGFASNASPERMQKRLGWVRAGHGDGDAPARRANREIPRAWRDPARKDQPQQEVEA